MTQDLECRKATFRKLKALYAGSIVALAAVILLTVQPMTWVRGTDGAAAVLFSDGLQHLLLAVSGLWPSSGE